MASHTRRREFLINRPFQIRFSFFVVTWVFALSTVYPVIVHQIFYFFQNSVALPPDALDVFEGARKGMIGLILLFHLVFTAMIFLISLFVSHKIAGPLHKLQTFMNSGANGKDPGELNFRKSDYFQELAEAFNRFKGRLGNRGVGDVTAVKAKIESAMTGANDESKKQLQEALSELGRLEKQTNTS